MKERGGFSRSRRRRNSSRALCAFYLDEYALWRVIHPAGKAHAGGKAVNEGPETDALYSAVNHDAQARAALSGRKGDALGTLDLPAVSVHWRRCGFFNCPISFTTFIVQETLENY